MASWSCASGACVCAPAQLEMCGHHSSQELGQFIHPPLYETRRPEYFNTLSRPLCETAKKLGESKGKPGSRKSD